MARKTFDTEKAAVTGGPYSQAVIHNDLIFLSGAGAVDPATNEIRLGTVEEETRIAFENIRIILEEAGSSLDNILRVTVYLLDMKDYFAFNDVYREILGQENLPARTCFQAAELPFDTRVEIDVIAAL